MLKFQNYDSNFISTPVFGTSLLQPKLIVEQKRFDLNYNEWKKLQGCWPPRKRICRLFLRGEVYAMLIYRLAMDKTEKFHQNERTKRLD